MLHREDIGVEIGYPLLAFLGDPQITQCIPDVWPDLLPEEIRIVVSQIRNALVPQFVAHPCFTKFGEQGRLLSKVVDVGQLADQICGTD